MFPGAFLKPCEVVCCACKTLGSSIKQICSQKLQILCLLTKHIILTLYYHAPIYPKVIYIILKVDEEIM